MHKYFSTVTNASSGRPFAGAVVRVLDENDDLATLYSDVNGTPVAVPGQVTTDDLGFYEFYVSNGVYTLQIMYGGEVFKTVTDVTISADVTELALSQETGAAMVGVVGGGNAQDALDAIGDGTGIDLAHDFVDAPAFQLQTVFRQACVLAHLFRKPGDTTDTAAVTRALATGYPVRLVAGQGLLSGGAYNVADVALTTGAVIFGDGMGRTILRQPDLTVLGGGFAGAAACFHCDSGGPSTFISGIRISDLTCYGYVEDEGFFEFNHLIHLNGVADTIIERVECKGFQGDALQFGSGRSGTERHNKNVKVRDCVFDGVNNDNRQAISFITVDGALVTGNTFRNCTRSTMPGAIDCEPDVASYHVIRNVKVVDNHFDNVGGNVGAISIYIPPTVTAQAQGIQIVGNTFTNLVNTNAVGVVALNSNASTDDMAVLIALNTGVGGVRTISLEACNGVSVRDNRWQGFTNIGYIGNAASSRTAHNVTIAGDEYSECATASGAQGFFVSAANNITVRDIKVIDCCETGASASLFYFPSGTSSYLNLENIEAPGVQRFCTKDASHTFTPATNRQVGNRVGAAPNAFEAYYSDVEQSFTPIVEGATTVGVGTYSVQYGRYRRVGDTVFYKIRVKYTGHTGTGLIVISAPPIEAAVITEDIFPAEQTVGRGAGLGLAAGENAVAFLHYFDTTAISPSSLRLYKQSGSTISQVGIHATLETDITVCGSYKVA